MKGFFLSLVLLSISLLQVSLAQQPSLVIQTDTIELGQPLTVAIKQASFIQQQTLEDGPWEVFKVENESLELLSFVEGIHRLPALSYKTSNGNTEIIASDQLIVVQLPASVRESESPRAIASPITIPATWLDWTPQLAAIGGAFLWALLWLLATVRQYGPAQKDLPPPTARTIALHHLQHRDKGSPASSFSHSQQVFRSYLDDVGIDGARTIPPAELLPAEGDSFQEKESFREIVSMIENQDQLRFSGEPVSGQDSEHFFHLVQQFIEQQPSHFRELSDAYLIQYGRAATAPIRILSGWLDLFPIWLTISGLLLWPGFIDSVAAPEWLTEPLFACLMGIAGALLLRTISAWMTITSPWKATPGMRLMKLTVVGQADKKALRPVLWLCASIPLFLGHIGIFGRSGLSIIDSLMGQQIRRYPLQPGKE